MLTKDKAFSIARKLAKSEYYQTVYTQEKMRLKIFVNNMDLTDLQIYFLDYLNLYHGLYIDLALKEIDEKIFECEIYEDAYVYWKNHKKPDKEKVNKRPQRPETTQNPTGNKFSWLFKRNK